MYNHHTVMNLSLYLISIYPIYIKLPPLDCLFHSKNQLKHKWDTKIIEAFNEDQDSRLGTYYRINTDLSMNYKYKLDSLETERILITIMMRLIG